jgi:protein-tyrosine-phosphatase
MLNVANLETAAMFVGGVALTGDGILCDTCQFAFCYYTACTCRCGRYNNGVIHATEDNSMLMKQALCGWKKHTIALLLGGALSGVAWAEADQAISLVCTGNTGRSPMAEGLANQVLHFPQAGYPTFSRGVKVNPQHITPETDAVKAMRQVGVNIGAHRAKAVSVADIASAKLVLTMTQAQKASLLALDPSAADKVFSLSECANGTKQDVSDPYGHDMTAYRQARQQITRYLQQIQADDFRCVTQAKN